MDDLASKNDSYNLPLFEILESNTSQPIQQKTPALSIKQSLDELFPEQKYEEKNIKKAKEILGNISEELTTEELNDTVVKMQYLCETWMDDFERKIFKGVTLQELLHEKGGKW